MRTMSIFLAFLCGFGIFLTQEALAENFGSCERFVCASSETRSLEARYLKEARRYRAQGRYELARQSYAQALSICTKESRIPLIRKELEGVELLLRTMR